MDFDDIPKIIVSAVIPAFFGFLGGISVQWVGRLAFLPRLKISTQSEGCLVKTNVPGPAGGDPNHCFVRLKVTNTKRWIAKNCRVYVTSIRNVSKSGATHEVVFTDTLRLIWAYESDEGELHAGIDIPHGVSFFVDVISTAKVRRDSGYRDVVSLEAASESAKKHFVNELAFEQTYHFEIVVTAEGAAAIVHSFDVELGPHWDDVKAIG